MTTFVLPDNDPGAAARNCAEPKCENPVKRVTYPQRRFTCVEHAPPLGRSLPVGGGSRFDRPMFEPDEPEPDPDRRDLWERRLP